MDLPLIEISAPLVENQNRAIFNSVIFGVGSKGLNEVQKTQSKRWKNLKP
jgi:hypothetical protein